MHAQCMHRASADACTAAGGPRPRHARRLRLNACTAPPRGCMHRRRDRGGLYSADRERLLSGQAATGRGCIVSGWLPSLRRHYDTLAWSPRRPEIWHARSRIDVYVSDCSLQSAVCLGEEVGSCLSVAVWNLSATLALSAALRRLRRAPLAVVRASSDLARAQPSTVRVRASTTRVEAA